MELYLFILPIALGILCLVAGLIFYFAYSFANDMDTKRRAYPWFVRLLLAALILLSMGIFLTARQFAF